jgi:hypothetical protein
MAHETASEMDHRAFADDTSAIVHERQAAHWRTMSVMEKAEMVSVMCRDCDHLAVVGIRYREPDVSEARERWLLMSRRYGRPFATRVLGDEPPRAAAVTP